MESCQLIRSSAGGLGLTAEGCMHPLPLKQNALMQSHSETASTLLVNWQHVFSIYTHFFLLQLNKSWNEFQSSSSFFIQYTQKMKACNCAHLYFSFAPTHSLRFDYTKNVNVSFCMCVLVSTLCPQKDSLNLFVL